MSWLWQAIVLFAVTNIDDMVVLSLFFGRANRAPGSTRRIVIGRYLGFGALLAVCVAGALGAEQLPDHGVAYLGLVPIAIGLHAGYRAWKPREDSNHHDGADKSITVWAVAGLTISNGGDNIGVYIPAFATYSGAKLAGVAAVFLILVGVGCLVAYYLTAHRAIAAVIEQWGHVIYPIALIVIGLVILIKGGAFGL